MAEHARRALLILSTVALAAAAAVRATGGLSVHVAGALVRVHRPAGLLAVAAIALLGAVALGGPRSLAADFAAAWDRRDRASRWVAAAACAMTLAVGLAWGTWTAAGADASGYVSQAAMFAGGHWHIDQPLARQVPWPDADRTFSPLGYRPATRPGAIVPTYPPGLPLAMALPVAIVGDTGAYLVVPLFGALAVWLAFVAGRRLSGAPAGALAAVALAASPSFLYQLVQPMSDVPVTAWWLAALVLASAGRGGASGLCAGAAVLTRPNLAPLAALLAIGVALAPGRPSYRAGARALARFAAGLLPAASVLLALNTAWYGHPLASGYGSLRDVFAWANVLPNLERYPRWLLETHSPFVFLGVALPFVAAWDRRRRGPDTPGPAIGPAVFGLVFSLAVVGCYLPYARFEEWWYLRFLLPAIAVALVMAAAVTLAIVERLPPAARVPVLVLAAAALTSTLLGAAVNGRAFELRRLEARYAAAGALVTRVLPPQAVLFAAQESGSLRYYTGRPVLRWDVLDPAWLDRAVAHLASRGYAPYLVLEAWEEPEFRARCSGSSEIGRLDWPPAAEIGQAERVRVYDPRDRARFLSGQPIRTLRPPAPP